MQYSWLAVTYSYTVDRSSTSLRWVGDGQIVGIGMISARSAASRRRTATDANGFQLHACMHVRDPFGGAGRGRAAAVVLASCRMHQEKRLSDREA